MNTRNNSHHPTIHDASDGRVIKILILNHHFMGGNVDEVRRIYKSKRDSEHSHVIFDMQRVRYISSDGIALLVTTKHECSQNSRELILDHVSDSVMTLLRHAKLASMFTFRN